MNIESLYTIFLQNLHHIDKFVKEFFGEGNPVLKKNKGLIQNQNFNIKGNKIKGYSFHGYGCLFQFSRFTIDIEFREDRIGFTEHEFSKFINNQTNIFPDELSVKQFLLQKVNRLELGVYENVFVLPQKSGVATKIGQ